MKMQITWVDDQKEKEMNDNEYKEGLQQLKATMEILKNVIDFGEKFEGLEETKPKEETKSQWKDIDSKLLVDDKTYLIRWETRYGWSRPIIAHWDAGYECFLLCDGPTVPIAIKQFMEIPE